MSYIEWYNDHIELHKFLTAMNSFQMFVSLDEALEFLEKPWNWSTEHQCWLDYGAPQADDDNWDEFDEALVVVVNG